MAATRRKKTRRTSLVDQVEGVICLIRGEKVMLDADLARLYGVEAKVLLQAVRRNPGRFPEDFAFRLSRQEFANLRSQTVTSSWGGRRYPPMAFTEQGVAMLSSVLRSKRAIEVNVQIMRAFVRLRELMLTHRDLATKLDALQKKFARHEEHFTVVFDAIRRLLEAPREPTKGRIGFAR